MRMPSSIHVVGVAVSALLLLSAMVQLATQAGHTVALLSAGGAAGGLAALFALAGTHLVRTRAALAAAHQRISDLDDQLAQANTDPVTGLPVRRLAEAYIAAAHTLELTVAVLDVDDMHGINNDRDHQFGDAYLAGIAQRLRALAHDGDLVGRLGGDEFVFATPRDLWQATDALVAAFGEPLTIGGVEVPMQVSVGLCQLPGGDVHTALGCADRAMLTAKRRGNVLELYDAARDGIPDPETARPAVRPRDKSAPRTGSHD